MTIPQALKRADEIADCDLTFAEAMNAILDAAQEAVPSAAWDAMRDLPFEEDQALADRWLRMLIETEPPGPMINGLWFGIFHPIVDGEARPAYYVSGSPDYPAEDWPCNTAWWAEHRYAPSECLAQMHRIAETAEGRVTEWADYPVLYGFVACITVRAIRALGAEALLAGRKWLAIAIGFDAGDLRAFGELTPSGIDREAPRARRAAWREANPKEPAPTPSRRALPPVTLPDDGNAAWYLVHLPERTSDRGWVLEDAENDEDGDWEARMDLLTSLGEAGAPSELPETIAWQPTDEAPESDWTLTTLEELPVVHAPLADAIAAITPEDLRLIPSTVVGSEREYRTLVIDRVVDCLDLGASNAVRMRDVSLKEADVSRRTYKELWKDNPQIWSYDQVVLRPNRMPAGEAVFRIQDLLNHIVVSADVARLLAGAGTTGVALTPIPLAPLPPTS